MRLIQDMTAKGLYRANHTYRDGKGKLIPKPESEWVFTPVEAIVSDELWRKCNDLLDEGKTKITRGPKPTHLFAGLLFCGCGQRMYVFSRSPKYVCPKCRNKIPIQDIETIFREELEGFFLSKDKVQAHLSNANQYLAEKKERLAAHSRQIEKVRAEMRKVYQLFQTDHVTPEGFGNLYRPLEDQERSLTAELPRLQAEVDTLEIQQLSADEVVSEATNLHRLWPKFTVEEKRKIVESITEKIVVSGDEIDITLCYMPSSEELIKRQRNLCATLPFCERVVNAKRRNISPVWTRSCSVSKEPQTIGGHLRKRRFNLGIRQSEAAERLGVSQRTLSLWETDRVYPTWPHQPAVIAYLGCNPFTDPALGRPGATNPHSLPFYHSETSVSLGQQIMKCRLQMKKTRKQLAREMGVSVKTLWSWETNRRLPTAVLQGQLMKFLEINSQPTHKQ